MRPVNGAGTWVPRGAQIPEQCPRGGGRALGARAWWAAAVLATTMTPVVPLSSRCTMPGRTTPVGTAPGHAGGYEHGDKRGVVPMD